MATPITAYKADDGTFYLTEDKADIHNAKLQLSIYMNSNIEYTDANELIGTEDMIGCITKHADAIYKYLNVYMSTTK